MRSDRVFGAVTLGVLSLVLVAVVLVIRRAYSLEAGLAEQSRQIRVLGEATDRLTPPSTAPFSVRREPPTTKEAIPAGVTLRHPDVENFLRPADTHWPTAGAATNGTLVRSFEFGDPKGFNPLLESSAVLEERIFTYCRIRLAEPNSWTNPSSYYGTLAFRIEVTDDSKEFTAYLRPGVKWHPVSGVNLDDPKYAWLRGDRDVTAQDVAFTLDLIKNPRVEGGRWKNLYDGLESYRALDEHTLVVRWKRKEYMNVAATLGLWATPRFLYENDENGKPFPRESLGLRQNQHWYDTKGFVGAGPYRMTSYEPGSKIVLERNERYVGERPAIRKLVYLIYSDAKQTLLKLRARELGDGELTPGQYREEILTPEKLGKKPPGSPFFDGSLQCRKVPRLSYSYVAWNARRPMFADRRVRRAMTHAFDRQRIVDNVYAGLGSVATGPYPLDSPNNDPGVTPIPFDLFAARKLLKEAGWVDTDGDGLLDKDLGPSRRSPFEFRMSLPIGQAEAETTVKIFADDLLKIGVKLTLEPQEWGLLQRRKDERDFDAYVAGFTGPWLVDLYPTWHSSQADVPRGSNAVGFRNPEADRLIEELRVTFDETARTRLFRAFHRIVHDEQPYTFVMVRRKVHCASGNVKNLVYAKDAPVENSLPWWVDGAAR